jgi:hypothetical protein
VVISVAFARKLRCALHSAIRSVTAADANPCGCCIRAKLYLATNAGSKPLTQGAAAAGVVTTVVPPVVTTLGTAPVPRIIFRKPYALVTVVIGA